MVDQIDTGASSVSSSEMSYFNELDQKAMKECLETCQKIQSLPIEHLILINVATQKLHLIKEGAYLRSYDVSTAAKGLGQAEGSQQTPAGLHYVDEKIGEGQEAEMIFESGQPTGQLAKAEDDKSFVVGRILLLSGAQEAVNQGSNGDGVNVDSKARAIYIHGTNLIQEIGKATSDGSIRMRPMDVVELFDRVPTKTPVYVYNA